MKLDAKKSADKKKAEKIKIEQLKVLYSTSFPVAFAHVISALVAVYLFWDQQGINHQIMLILVSMVIFFAIVRVGIYLFYNRRIHAGTAVKEGERAFLIGTALIAISWSALGIFIFKEADSHHQLIMIAVLISVTAVATLTLSASRFAFRFFIILIIVPMFIMLLSQQYHDALLLSALVLLFFVGMLMGGERNYRNIVQYISMRLESDAREEVLRISEMRLKESEERFSLANTAANEGLWDWDLQSGTVYFSPRWKKILGYEPDELPDDLTKSWINRIHPDERAKVMNDLEKKKASTEQFFEIEYRIKHKDGSWRYILSKSVIVRNDYGEPTRMVGTFSDITETKILEEQFRQSQKMEALGTLVGGLAHDFNNMLAAILGNTYMAKKSTDRPEKLMKHITTIETISSRASGMIKQLLSFSRKGELQMTVVSVKDLMKESFQMARQGMPANVELKCKGSEQKLFMIADIATILQAMMNLLNNARDAVYGMTDATIVCSMERYDPTPRFLQEHPDLKAKSYIKISVKDNGHGIEPDQLKKVFEPFFTTKGVDKGTGLGLAMVFGAVKNHGGTIEVQSVVGKGTVFSIYLPAVNSEIHMEESGQHVVTGNGELILLVDDNEDLRDVTLETLTVIGYKVLASSDGEKGLEMFRQFNSDIDLVITDVVMPKLGGVELFKKIRGMGSKVPIMFQTGYDETIPTLTDKMFDGVPVIHKPFTIETLSFQVKKILDASKTEGET